jgi:hypothetical protein
MKIYKMRNKVTDDMKALIKGGRNPLYVARSYATINRIIMDRIS